MAVTAERRKEIQAEIRQWLEEQGVSRGDGARMVEKYQDVPRSTVLRWYKQLVNETGASRKKVAKTVAKKIKSGAKEIRKKASGRRVTLRKVAKVTKEIVPETVSIEDINPVAAISAVDQARECIQHATNVLDYCISTDGRLRNPNLYLKASAHQRASIETLAKITEQLNDAQRIDQTLAAIFEEIRKVDRDAAERILLRLQHLQTLWGLR